MEIPSEKIKATSKSPNKLLVYGLPKVGKTSSLAELENSITIDLERGSKFVDSLHVSCDTPAELAEFVAAIKEKNKSNGDKPFFKYGIVDTATKLEEFAETIGVQLYQSSSMGKSFKGNALELKALPMGAGYGYIRNAYKMLVNTLAPLFDRLILVGHTKDKVTSKEDREVASIEVDLSGKLAQIVTQNVDAIGYVYRKKDKLYLSFKTDGEIATGNRAKHLSGKEILLSEYDEKGKLITHWDQVFID